MSCFIFDIESLATESTSVVLSAALLYVPESLLSDPILAYQELLDNCCFVKFNSAEQKANGRLVAPDTLAWWRKQGIVQQRKSLFPSSNDLSIEDGFQILKKYWESFPNYKNLPIWTRGGLDQMCIESLWKSANLIPFIDYNCYRDIRTAISIFYTDTEKGGYVEIPGFDTMIVNKHDPCHDCAYDALMLFKGKTQ